MTLADLSAITNAFGDTLPGVDAQLTLAHPARSLAVPAGVEPRQAGVLILLYPNAKGELCFPLIERAGKESRDPHRGQIGLPGGKREDFDASIIDTALREAEEEVGALASEVQVLATLSPLYIPVSNFLVTATVGTTSAEPKWQRQVTEVERVITVRVSDLMRDDVVGHTDRDFGNGLKLTRVPHFTLANEVVWGATAMMLSELRSVLRAL